MRLRYLTLLSALAILSSSTALAQAYDDDIYYNSNTSKSTTKVSKQRNSTVANAGNYSRTTKTTQPTVYSSTIENDRDVDEYNRRGGRYAVDVDTLSDELMDTSYNEENYANTKRLERFYNPDIVSGSDDAELIDSYYDSYYDDTPTVNLYIGSNWGWGGPGYSIGWGVYPSYYSWYDPWYDPWYGPSWYYSGWYGPRWNHWGWGGWYDPWYAGWGWNYGWGWAGGWYAGWHHGGWYGGPGWRDGGRGRDNWGYNSIGNGGRRSMTNTSGARRPMSNGNSMSGARGRSGYASLGTNNSNAVNGTRRATSSGTITGHRGASTTNRSSVGNVGSMSSRRSTLINRSTMSSGAASTQSARATASQSNSTISRSDINNSTRQSYSRSSAAQSSSRNSYNTTTSRSSSSYSSGRSSSGSSFGGSGGFSGGGRSSGSVSGGHRR